jgi:hypothetical protein
LKNLPADLVDGAHLDRELSTESSQQSVEEIDRILAEARIPAPSFGIGHYLADESFDVDDAENDNDLDVESSGEYVCAI